MSTQNKNEYLLMIRGDDWYNRLSTEELQTMIKQTRGWFENLAATGKTKPGAALARDGAVVASRNGRVIDGPFAESKEAVGGFMTLIADNLAEAIAVAKTSPCLAHGASIEVRPIAEECPLDACLREKLREADLVPA